MQSDRSGGQDTILKAQDLGYKNDGKVILKDITFDLKLGEHLAVVGSSGSGKSTLLRLLNRLLEPTQGRVIFNGQDYTEIPPRELRRRIGLILQQPYSVPRHGGGQSALRAGPKRRGDFRRGHRGIAG